VPPNVGITVLAPQASDPVTETRLQINSETDDGDGGNDYINRIVLSDVPTGVTLSSPNSTITAEGGGNYTIFTSGNPGTFNPEVDVTTPAGQTTNFNLGVKAYSDEPNSPEQSATTSQNIDVEYSTQNDSSLGLNPFQSTGQSIWGSGNAFTTTIDKFLGIDFPNGYPTSPPYSKHTTVLGTNVGGTFGLKAGFQSDLNINGGSFNGSLPFNVTLDNTYNKTNDTLELDPAAPQGTGNFMTTGPGGSYSLDFIFDAVAKAELGPIGTVGFGTTSKTVSLLHLNSSTLSKMFTLPDGIGSVTVNWPQVNTKGTSAATTITASKTSVRALQLDIDPIAVISDIVLGKDPFKGSTSLTIAKVPIYSFSYTLLKGTVAPGVDLKQAFSLFDNGLTPTLTTTNGTPVSLNFGTPTIIDNASTLDTGPGTIGFNLGLTPDTSLENDTSLEFQLTLGLKALGVHGSIAGIGGA
jgi:hypothetical protein